MSFGENALIGGGVGETSPQYYDHGAKMARSPSCKQRIDMAVKQAEERLAKVKEAKEILDRNPDLERLLDIMQQSHF